MDTAFSVASFGLSFASGIFGASAQRKSARAELSALREEKAWNIGVMRQNAIDTYASDILSSYASGIDSSTGSNAAIISRNQSTLSSEIAHQSKMYDIQTKQANAASKKKFLGIF